MSAAFILHRTGRPVPHSERAQMLQAPAFGRHFTDHMASATWTPEDEWHDHRVAPLEPFALHPGTAVFHYAQEVFEGLKAYRHPDGSVWLFRPEVNARRFARSARRLALPELPDEDFLASVEGLVHADESWVPPADGERSLYLRPFMFASDAFLGLRPARRVVYAVIATPTGSYYTSGITLWVSDRYTRAARGGTGAAKCGANYAAGLAAETEARQHGCDQVLYLDSAGEGRLEESGTMNLCLVTSDGRLVTPELGTILDGVTRDSVLTLAADFDLEPVERKVTLDELRRGARESTISEVFAVGTAVVVTPVVAVKGDGYEFVIGNGTPGKRTMAMRDHLLDIQYGRVEDTHGWMRRVL